MIILGLAAPAIFAPEILPAVLPETAPALLPTLAFSRGDMTDRVDQICELFMRDSQGQLDPAAVADLRVAVRISVDFWDFLARYGSAAPPSEVEYMMNTIRSGIDDFFSVAVLHCVLQESTPNSGLEWIEAGDVEATRSAYETRFRALMNPDIGFAERLENLLSLCQGQLVFLAQGFKLIV